MPQDWSIDKKRSVSLLYKIGKQMISNNSKVDYLTKCLKNRIIPKTFQITQGLPGNSKFIKERTEHLSFELIQEELRKAKCELFEIQSKFEKAKVEIYVIFGFEEGEKQILRHRTHFLKALKIRNKKMGKKLIRDSNKNVNNDKNEDKDSVMFSLPFIFKETEFLTPNPRKRRKFKRKYNQPQPKKERQNKRKLNKNLHESEKNIPKIENFTNDFETENKKAVEVEIKDLVDKNIKGDKIESVNSLNVENVFVNEELWNLVVFGESEQGTNLNSNIRGKANIIHMFGGVTILPQDPSGSHSYHNFSSFFKIYPLPSKPPPICQITCYNSNSIVQYPQPIIEIGECLLFKKVFLIVQ